jgi:hypothetical protein
MPTLRFIVRYHVAGPGTETFEWRCFAFDADHAAEKFLDNAGGWTEDDIVSVDRPRGTSGRVDRRFDRASAEVA